MNAAAPTLQSHICDEPDAPCPLCGTPGDINDARKVWLTSGGEARWCNACAYRRAPGIAAMLQWLDALEWAAPEAHEDARRRIEDAHAIHALDFSTSPGLPG